MLTDLLDKHLMVLYLLLPGTRIIGPWSRTQSLPAWGGVRTVSPSSSSTGAFGRWNLA
jgi:hypothetical protein